MARIIAMIPSRLESSRVPRKPLVDISGMPMVLHVYHRAKLSSIPEEVIVATDSEEIKSVVEAAGGQAILTSRLHANGTERLAEAVARVEADFVILVNGDEALLNPDHLRVSYEALINSRADVSILVSPFTKENSPSDFKVVLNLQNEVMYISRGDVPCSARNPVKQRLKAYHIMTFHRSFLQTYATLPKSPLEAVEDHEHLRVLENGYRIIAAQVESSAISIDTPEDLAFARTVMQEDPLFKRYSLLKA